MTSTSYESKNWILVKLFLKSFNYLTFEVLMELVNLKILSQLQIKWWMNVSINCHNLSLGLATKVGACKGAGQEGSLRVTSHSPESVGEFDEMNLHTPKWTPILRVGVPDGRPNLHRTIVGVKTHWIEEFLISLEIPWNLNV